MQLDHFFPHSRGLLCAACENLGHTIHDIGKYKCKDCKQLLGRRKFEANSIMNHNARTDTHLICQDCREREKSIKKKFKLRGSWKCKCGKPIHTEKCDLFNGYSERRWPGKNKGVSADDWTFWCLRKRE